MRAGLVPLQHVGPMERVLVPLDGSSLAETVLPIAEALAREHQAEVLLLRAVPTGTERGEFEEGEAQAYLLRVSGELQDRGVLRVRWIVWCAKPAQAIVEATSRNRADLIAMTTHGRTGLGQLLLGSVAEGVVRHSPTPVLLVRGQPSWSRGQITRILVPLDGSKLAETILPVVERLAGPLDFEIHLFRAVEPVPSGLAEVSTRLGEVGRLREREAEEYLRNIADAIEAKGLRVRRAVRRAPVVEAVQEYTGEAQIGLVGMATHGRTGLDRLLFGSVAERVLRAVRVPVVLWKPPGEASARA